MLRDYVAHHDLMEMGVAVRDNDARPSRQEQAIE